jgi:ABC-2 type transport system ATP-binding protein
MTEALVVRTEGLTKAYGQRVALTDLCLEIGAGEVFGYLGPNGAGKTTTLRLLAGMLRPTSGRAHVLGYDAWRDSVEVHREMGYLSGEPALYDRLTGREHAAYLGFLRHHVTPDRVEELSVRLDLDLDRPARELSKGNKQKLALVLAMMSTPTLLVLDEPTGGLDPIAQQEFHQILREHTDGGGSVLLSSHVLSEVQRVADRWACCGWAGWWPSNGSTSCVASRCTMSRHSSASRWRSMRSPTCRAWLTSASVTRR